MAGCVSVHKAVAIQYNKDLPAPFVVAKGVGKTALRMTEIARENNIEVVREPILSEELIDLDVGSLVPEELYEIVAELLAYIYTLQVKT